MGEVSWLGGTVLPGAPEEKASGWEKVLSPLAALRPPSTEPLLLGLVRGAR